MIPNALDIIIYVYTLTYKYILQGDNRVRGLYQAGIVLFVKFNQDYLHTLLEDK
jgi:hypothetical protein